MWNSDYGRGLKCGMIGDPLPYDVPLESHFTEGWRDGVEIKKMTLGITDHVIQIKGMTFGIAANSAATENVKSFSLSAADPDELPDDTSWWPLTWPEGIEGAALHIPRHHIAAPPHKVPPLTNFAGLRSRPVWYGN